MSQPNEVPTDQAAEPTFLPAVQTESGKMLAELSGDRGQFRSNLPLDQAWAKTWFLKASADPDVKLDSLGGKEFEIAYYHAKVVTVTLESGELEPRIRVTLFDPRGQTLAWTSRITSQKFGELLQCFGVGPWSPPIKVTIVQNKGKKAGYFYTFKTPLLAPPETKKGR